MKNNDYGIKEIKHHLKQLSDERDRLVKYGIFIGSALLVLALTKLALDAYKRYTYYRDGIDEYDLDWEYDYFEDDDFIAEAFTEFDDDEER